MKEEIKGSEKFSFKDHISKIWNGLKKLVQFFKFQLVAVVSYWSDFALYSMKTDMTDLKKLYQRSFLIYSVYLSAIY